MPPRQATSVLVSIAERLAGGGGGRTDQREFTAPAAPEALPRLSDKPGRGNWTRMNIWRIKVSRASQLFRQIRS